MMENNNTVQHLLAQTDIYLIDQLQKGLYKPTDMILDAGCGTGRNMHWFLQNNFHITGIDPQAAAIHTLRNNYPSLAAGRSFVSAIEDNDLPAEHFDHIICSAVLHFANDTDQFKNMLAALVRMLKTGGSLFIRMASDIGIEDKIIAVGEGGVYLLPDGSKRFLLTGSLLQDCMHEHKLVFIEPLKTTNVNDLRCMSTLVLRKALAL